MKILHLFHFLLFSFVSCRSQSPNNNIVLINAESGDKLNSANVIFAINKLEPKVIAIDMSFSDEPGSKEDLKLFEALDKCSMLILPTTIETLSNDKDVFGFPNPMGFLTLTNIETGFVSGQIVENQITIPKNFFTQHSDFNGNTSYHFSVVTAMAFDSVKAKTFVDKHATSIEVKFENYRGFKTFKASEVLKGKLKRSDIEGKIVMMGFLGPGDQDKFYSPLNKDMKKPDLYGLEYLALIVSQILGLD